MKKTIKHADGTEEVFESSPEELAEYEKNLNESSKDASSSSKKKKKLLNERLETLEAAVAELKKPIIVPSISIWPQPVYVPYLRPYVPYVEPYNPYPYELPWWQRGVQIGDFPGLGQTITTVETTTAPTTAPNQWHVMSGNEAVVGILNVGVTAGSVVTQLQDSLDNHSHNSMTGMGANSGVRGLAGGRS